MCIVDAEAVRACQSALLLSPAVVPLVAHRDGVIATCSECWIVLDRHYGSKTHSCFARKRSRCRRLLLTLRRRLIALVGDIEDPVVEEEEQDDEATDAPYVRSLPYLRMQLKLVSLTEHAVTPPPQVLLFVS